MYEVRRMGHVWEVVCGLIYEICRMGRVGDVVCGLINAELGIIVDNSTN